MARYVWSPRYEADIGPHVFPTRKYRLIVDRLQAEDGVQDADLVQPLMATEEEILRVHEAGYYRRCRDGTLGVDEILRLELPWSDGLFEAASHCVRGSSMAAAAAIAHGVGLHVGGGFHHAFAGHGEGFCVFNDVACAVRALQARGQIRTALVIDCDLHQGNGTAAIFAGDPDVRTYSMHQLDIYPPVKPPSTVDVPLAAGTGDEEYLRLLRDHALPMLAAPVPDLVIYVAGADPFEQDQLGSLSLTREGLRRRDRLVVEGCRANGIPLVVVLAGGYARRPADTVEIHLTTLREARRLL